MEASEGVNEVGNDNNVPELQYFFDNPHLADEEELAWLVEQSGLYSCTCTPNKDSEEDIHENSCDLWNFEPYLWMLAEWSNNRFVWWEPTVSRYVGIPTRHTTHQPMDRIHHNAGAMEYHEKMVAHREAEDNAARKALGISEDDSIEEAMSEEDLAVMNVLDDLSDTQLTQILEAPTDDIIDLVDQFKEGAATVHEGGEIRVPSDVKCCCVPEKKWFCFTCQVERANPEDPWKVFKAAVEEHESNQKLGLTPQEKEDWDGIVSGFGYTPLPGLGTTTVAKSVVGYQSQSKHTPYVPKCRHMERPVEFPDGTIVYATSWASSEKPSGIPDFGLYAADSWKARSVATFIPWRDYGLPECPWYMALGAIVDAYNLAQQGFSVEVGCIGGHGRTGTILACMAVLAGVPGEEAVDWIQENYCSHAVESVKQEWWVLWFESVVTETKLEILPPWDLDPPPPPKPKPYVAPVKKPGTTTAPVKSSVWKSPTAVPPPPVVVSTKPEPVAPVNAEATAKGTAPQKRSWLGNPFRKTAKQSER